MYLVPTVLAAMWLSGKFKFICWVENLSVSIDVVLQRFLLKRSKKIDPSWPILLVTVAHELLH